jgi:SAM-dependent methyltransferase
MIQTRSTAEKAAYRQAASTGKYEKPSGLLGKYDNVRRFWEDRVTARFLAGPLNDLVVTRIKDGKGVSVLDLGCGAGDGVDLLQGIDVNGMNMGKSNTAILNDRTFERYMGLDLSEELLEQANLCHGGKRNIGFMQGDLSNGLPVKCLELAPFDLYFAGYGTLSHFHDEQTVKIVGDICAHASPGAIFVGDWLGRYSYEWVDLWDNSTDRELFMDYRISYIYDEQDRPHAQISSFPLRLMSRQEILRTIEKAASEAGVEIEPLLFFDRSALVGRHMDTGDYNKKAPKIRAKVNSLFEQNQRTELEALLFEYYPSQGFKWQNSFFDSFFSDCNRLVEHTSALLEGDEPSVDESWSQPLKEAANMMSKTAHAARGFDSFDGRANLIEPALGYCLRKLEMDLQPGEGVGHGMVGVFRINK